MARNQKPKKDSLITLTRKYANNLDECVKFFFKMKFDLGTIVAVTVIFLVSAAETIGDTSLLLYLNLF